jgi:hypothetical protein
MAPAQDVFNFQVGHSNDLWKKTIQHCLCTMFTKHHILQDCLMQCLNIHSCGVQDHALSMLPYLQRPNHCCGR